MDPDVVAARVAVRRALQREVRASSPERVAKILGVRGERLETARSATSALGSTRERRRPGWERYDGVVWQHLDPASLTSSQRSRIWVPSALYGLHCASEEIADYRLKMGVTLPAIGNLANWWRPVVSHYLATLTPRTIVHLLPREHAAVIDPHVVGAQRLFTVDFVDASGQGAAGHAAKAVKGVLARHILRYGLRGLAAFSWEGWQVTTHATGATVTAP